jgi:hypothetical protein
MYPIRAFVNVYEFACMSLPGGRWEVAPPLIAFAAPARHASAPGSCRNLAISLVGALPKNRLYSRLNCEALR